MAQDNTPWLPQGLEDRVPDPGEGTAFLLRIGREGVVLALPSSWSSPRLPDRDAVTLTCSVTLSPLALPPLLCHINMLLSWNPSPQRLTRIIRITFPSQDPCSVPPAVPFVLCMSTFTSSGVGTVMSGRGVRGVRPVLSTSGALTIPTRQPYR